MTAETTTPARHVPYWCPTAENVECCPGHSGWDVCCDRPDLHVPVDQAPEPGREATP